MHNYVFGRTQLGRMPPGLRVPLSAVNQATLDRAALFDKEAARLERDAAELRRKAKEMRGE